MKKTIPSLLLSGALVLTPATALAATTPAASDSAQQTASQTSNDATGAKSAAPTAADTTSAADDTAATGSDTSSDSNADAAATTAQDAKTTTTQTKTTQQQQTVFVNFKDGATSHIDTRKNPNISFYCIGTTSDRTYNSPVYYDYSETFLTLAQFEVTDKNGKVITDSETNNDWYWDLDITGTTTDENDEGYAIDWKIQQKISKKDCTLESAGYDYRYVFDENLVETGKAVRNDTYTGKVPGEMTLTKAVLNVPTEDGTYAIDMTNEYFAFHEGICDAWGLVTEKSSSEITIEVVEEIEEAETPTVNTPVEDPKPAEEPKVEEEPKTEEEPQAEEEPEPVVEADQKQETEQKQEPEQKQTEEKKEEKKQEEVKEEAVTEKKQVKTVETTYTPALTTPFVTTTTSTPAATPTASTPATTPKTADVAPVEGIAAAAGLAGIAALFASKRLRKQR